MGGGTIKVDVCTMVYGEVMCNRLKHSIMLSKRFLRFLIISRISESQIARTVACILSLRHVIIQNNE